MITRAIEVVMDRKIYSLGWYLFKKLFEFYVDTAWKNIDNVSMDILSMGMSSDYVSAVRYGSNIVRIGSGMFGSRK